MALPGQQEKVTLDTFLRGLWEENPVFVMLLGLCPVLAVTNSTMNAIAMGLATTFVLVASSTLVSLLRNFDALEARLNAAGDALANAIHAVKHGNKTHPWQIDAISGATISSAAIGRMINASGQRMFPLIQRHLAELEARGTAADTASRTGTGDN